MILILNNGNLINNVTQNVDLFFTKQNISENTFLGGLDRVTFDYDDGTKEIKENLKLVTLREENDGFIFAFSEISEADLRYAQTRSDIEYIAMMTDVDLGTEKTL